MADSGDLTATLAELALAGVAVADAAGVVTHCNATAAALLGRSAAEAVGKPLASLLASYAGAEGVLERLSEGGAAGPVDGTLIPRRGGEAIAARAVPVDTPRGSGLALLLSSASAMIPTGAGAVALIQSLQRSSPVGHIIFDAAGRYVSINDAALAMNGGTRSDRLGRHITEVQPELAPSVLAAIGRVVSTGSAVQDRLAGRAATQGGRARIWRGTYYPVTGDDGTWYGIGLIFEDTTDAERATLHLQVVGQVTDALLRATTVEEVARVILWRVAPLLGARAAWLVLGGSGSSGGGRIGRIDLSSGELSWSPLPEGLAGAEPPPQGPGPRSAPWPAPGWAALGGGEAGDDGLLVVLPLGTDLDVPAALALVRPPGDDLDAGERSLLAAAADQCVTALGRARSLEAAEAASRLTVRLQGATARLADALSVEEIGSVVLAEARGGLGASGGGLGLVDPIGRAHRFVATFGWDQLELADVLVDRSLDETSLSAEALRRELPLYIARPDDLEGLMPAARARRITLSGEREAWVSVPLVGGNGALGTLSLSFASARRFVDHERAFLGSLAGQASAAIDRVRRYQAEHQIAAVLQRALLPERLPAVEGCALAVRYLAGAEGSQVGGDWYDAFGLERGHLALVVGDVAGHDLAAAGIMGHLRAQLRACARDELDAGQTLSDLDRLVHRLDGDPERFATLVYAVWRPGTECIELALAGHLPPLFLGPSGHHVPDLAAGPPIGASLGPAAYETHRVALEPGRPATVVLFTDGLVELPGRPLEEGISALLASAATSQADPSDLADHVLTELRPPEGWHDDVAMLVCRLARP